MKLDINLNASGSPNAADTAEAQATVTQIENFFDSIFTAPVTLNVNLDIGTLPPGAAADNDGFGAHSVTVSYDPVRSALIGMGAPGASTLPPPQPASLILTDAQARALGVGGATFLDGTINLGAVSFEFDLFGIMAHELTEIMGRGAGLSEIGISGVTVLDLYRYSAPGVFALDEPLNTPAYFSVDGGKTNLGQFFPTMPPGSGFDPGDWDNPPPNPPDSFGFAFSDDPVTPRDFLEMRALGWATTALPGAPTVAAAVQNNNSPNLAITGSVSNVDSDFHALKYAVDNGPLVDGTGFVNSNGTFTLTLADLGVGNGTHAVSFIEEDVLGQLSLPDTVQFTVSTPPPPPPPPPPPNPPIVIAGAIVSYTLGGPPVVADSILTVADFESKTLVGATVSIDPTEFVAGDHLNFTNQNGIVGAYNAGTGVLTLSGTSLVADYQAALESITFSTSAADPTHGGTDPSRALSWQVTDGISSSAVSESVVDLKGAPPPLPPPPGPGHREGPNNPGPPGGTAGFMVLSNAGLGASEIYDIGSNTILAAYSLDGVGAGLTFQGIGSLGGGDVTDMLFRDMATGDFTGFDVSGNSISNITDVGAVGLNWKFAGFGLAQSGGTDMFLRDANTGDFEAYAVRNNAIAGAANIGSVGLDWHVAGFGRFNGNDVDDMILRQAGTGAFEVYDANTNGLTGATSLGQVGTDWAVAGFGNFFGDGTTSMMLRNTSTGDFELYGIRNNQIVGAQDIGNVGLDWQVVGFTSANGVGTSDMILRQQGTGTFEVYDLANGHLTNAQTLGAVGTDWSVTGLSVDPVGSQAAQFAQAIAGLPSSGQTTLTPLSEEQHQQTPMLAPHV